MAEIKEECGVFGIYDLDGNDVTSSIYYGLTSLQHRIVHLLFNLIVVICPWIFICKEIHNITDFVI